MKYRNLPGTKASVSNIVLSTMGFPTPKDYSYGSFGTKQHGRPVHSAPQVLAEL